MYLLRGNSHMESGDYECAIQSFKYARAQLGNRTSRPPLVVSLVNLVALPCNATEWVTMFDRFPDGGLMILQSRSNRVFARPSMQRVARWKQASLF